VLDQDIRAVAFSYSATVVAPGSNPLLGWYGSVGHGKEAGGWYVLMAAGRAKSYYAETGSVRDVDRRSRFEGAKMRPWYDRGDRENASEKVTI